MTFTLTDALYDGGGNPIAGATILSWPLPDDGLLLNGSPALAPYPSAVTATSGAFMLTITDTSATIPSTARWAVRIGDSVYLGPALAGTYSVSQLLALASPNTWVTGDGSNLPVNAAAGLGLGLGLGQVTVRQIAGPEGPAGPPGGSAGADATTTVTGAVLIDAAPAAGQHPIALTRAGTALPAAMLGTTAATAAAGNDSRLSDARTPLAHETTHLPGGSDAFPWTTILGSGLDANKPAPAASNAGYLWLATDTNKLYQSTGSAWTLQLTGTATATIASTSAVGGVEIDTNPVSGNPIALTQAGTALPNGMLSSTVPTRSGTGAVGASTLAARADHVHPGTLGDPIMNMYSYLGWTASVDIATAASGALATGGIYLLKVYVPVGGTCNRISFATTTAEAGATTNENYLGLYDSTGALLWNSAAGAMDTTFAAATGAMTVTTSALSLASFGFYYVAILANFATTAPAFLATGSNSYLTNLHTSPTRYGSFAGPYTSLPATLTLSSMTAVHGTQPWFGLST